VIILKASQKNGIDGEKRFAKIWITKGAYN
jgi:hypothetical protein